MADSENTRLWALLLSLYTGVFGLLLLVISLFVWSDRRFSVVEEWQRKICERQQDALVRSGLDRVGVNRTTDCPAMPQHEKQGSGPPVL